MARLARVVIPGHPHHVTQRGNGRARTFFDDGDYALYRDLLAANCKAAGVEVWAWCLMPNHVHLILVPSDPDGLRHALARVHRSYAGTIQARRKRTGHFWQGRFGAVVMDEQHLAAALRYVSLNPVRARLVQRAQDWRWSSTRAHLRGRDDGLTVLGRSAIVFLISPICWQPNRKPICSARCVLRRVLDDHWEIAAFSPVSNARPDASSSRPSGPKPAVEDE
ncbi:MULTISPECIES: transposase [Bradyrhizobium]|uniref:transposase n=1 Tax=Bradyrhizobium TaxID=374 RepID=UPI001EDA970E|nr:transposase [Bradyrhizobium zhengyangense]MCG2642894.1 transposase [Bradyrhizobium zhengyangense]